MTYNGASERQKKRNKPKLDSLKTGHFQELNVYSSAVYARSRISVSFPCINLNTQGSPEPQRIKLCERKPALLILYIIKINNNNEKTIIYLVISPIADSIRAKAEIGGVHDGG